VKKRLLVVTRTSNENELHLLEPDCEKELIGSYRVSPLFSVAPDPFEPTGTFLVGFIFVEHAFHDIGWLLNELPQNHHNKLWFSHGLASVIVLCEEEIVIDEVMNILHDRIRAFEIWESTPALKLKGAKVCSPEPYDTSLLEIPVADGLTADVKYALQEFSHSVKAAMHRAAQYAPSQMIIFERLVTAVSTIVEGLSFLTNPTTHQTEWFSSSDIESLIADEVQRKKHFDFLASQLVQINSALSYIVSQAYSGAVPILEHECHIRSFSLLGVGTAYRALSSYARHVEMIFEQHPIVEVIRTVYPTTIGPAPFKQFGTRDTEGWDRLIFGVDRYIHLGTKSQDLPKLVYYSGRQGFRETKFTVTAPIQALNSAATVRWSLMTLSHELLHAHVMSILGVLFGNIHDSSNVIFTQVVKRFDEYRKSNCTEKPNLSDCISFVILNFCCFEHGININYSSEGVSLSKSNNVDKIKNMVAIYFADINDIIVHVLDYIYFYNQDDAVYIGLLWESWSPVPVVLEKIEHYLLRTLLAIGTKETGSIVTRYFSSLKIINRELTKLLERNPDNIVLKHAKEVLANNNSESSKMVVSFSNGINLADMAARFLASPHISGLLLNDTQRVLDEDAGTYNYNLDIGQFEKLQIDSPVALCDGLLRKSLTDKDESGADIASAWAFLACSSYKF